MTMRDQEPVQLAEPHPRFKDLPLGAFTAVQQKAVFVVLDDLRRQSAVNGWRGGGGAEKNYFKQ